VFLEIRPGKDGVYLVRLDSERKALTDTWHRDVDEAKAQALFEYAVTDGDWAGVNSRGWRLHLIAVR
jgi:hypothetical protein